MNVKQQTKDPDGKLAEAADRLYEAAVQFMVSLDSRLERDTALHGNANTAYLRHQKRVTRAFLCRVFPDQKTDTVPSDR